MSKQGASKSKSKKQLVELNSKTYNSFPVNWQGDGIYIMLLSGAYARITDIKDLEYKMKAGNTPVFLYEDFNDNGRIKATKSWSEQRYGVAA